MERVVFSVVLLLCLTYSAYSAAEFESHRMPHDRMISYLGIAGAIWAAFMLVFW